MGGGGQGNEIAESVKRVNHSRAFAESTHDGRSSNDASSSMHIDSHCALAFARPGRAAGQGASGDQYDRNAFRARRNFRWEAGSFLHLEDAGEGFRGVRSRHPIRCDKGHVFTLVPGRPRAQRQQLENAGLCPDRSEPGVRRKSQGCGCILRVALKEGRQALSASDRP